jgi:hypothetical protein
MQERQQLRDVAQQQVLQPSLNDKAKIADRKNNFSKDFTATVEPAMVWFRNKKRELEAELAECWAEGLYPPGQKEEDEDVKRHRQVSVHTAPAVPAVSMHNSSGLWQWSMQGSAA